MRTQGHREVVAQVDDAADFDAGIGLELESGDNGAGAHRHTTARYAEGAELLFEDLALRQQGLLVGIIRRVVVIAEKLDRRQLEVVVLERKREFFLVGACALSSSFARLLERLALGDLHDRLGTNGKLFELRRNHGLGFCHRLGIVPGADLHPCIRTTIGGSVGRRVDIRVYVTRPNV